MNYQIYSHVLIDLSIIWRTELDRYAIENNDQNWHEELYNYLLKLYLHKHYKPFINLEMVNEDNSLKGYYVNYYDRLEQYKKNGHLDFFEYKGGFYDMNESCIIEKDDVSLVVYQKLFAIKLKQLEENQKLLIEFITFHFYRTFQKDISQYNRFLSALQLQNDIISIKLFQIIEWWRLIAKHLLNEGLFQDEKENKPTWDAFNELLDVPDRGELNTIEVAHLNNYMENKSTTENETKQIIELQPILIEGEFNLDEILNYFSYLYFDKGEPDGSFLTKSEVEAIFKGGIAIPPKPLSQKYKLNLTPRFRRNQVDYFIYKFIQHYNVKAKKNILVFIGSYIEDYANALDPKKLGNLNKNITGEITPKFSINEKDLLPERFH